ncbi:MAG: prepilin-type N-terminal cleavage/methylation domain-containing protein [Acidobacteriota bacterium]
MCLDAAACTRVPAGRRNLQSAICNLNSNERGFTLVTLLVVLSVMMILMGVGMELWSSVMRQEREEELIFRGQQIVQAIRLYRAKFRGTYPPSLKVLQEQKFLRKLYEDPMTEDGTWNLVVASGGGEQGYALIPDTEQKRGLIQIIGVASRSKQKSARIYSNATTYDKWLFTIRDEEDTGERVRGGKRGRRGGQVQPEEPGEEPEEPLEEEGGEEPEEPGDTEGEG